MHTPSLAQWPALHFLLPPPPLTGNLLAPYLTAVTSDLLFTGYQRLKQRQVDAANDLALAQLKDLAATARLQADALKAAKSVEASQQAGDGGAKEGSDSNGSANGSANGSSNGSSASGSASGSNEAAPAVAAGSSKSEGE